MMIRVKICGMTRKEDLDAAAAAGADAVGFVVGVASSPRNLSLTEAEKLIRQVPPFVTSVLVTAPNDLEELAVICDKLNPDAVQIHGDLISVVREQLPRKLLIGAVKANPQDAVDNAAKAAEMFDAIILDSFAHGKHGGTGVIHDWGISRQVKHAVHPKPLILAGGLNPENVADAVRTVEPYAVDVSSGVEQQPGIKSHQKIVEFIKNAKEC
jgi:phosphoribosylanthranilate isomerase